MLKVRRLEDDDEEEQQEDIDAFQESDILEGFDDDDFELLQDEEEGEAEDEQEDEEADEEEGEAEDEQLEPSSGGGVRSLTLGYSELLAQRDKTSIALRRLEPWTSLTEHIRPRTRADCVDGLRPCPWVGCRHHLFLEVDVRLGSIQLNFPELEPDELEESCSLDLADQYDRTLEEVGKVLGVTRERVRQLEKQAVKILLRQNPELCAHLPNPNAIIERIAGELLEFLAIRPTKRVGSPKKEPVAKSEPVFYEPDEDDDGVNDDLDLDFSFDDDF